MRNIVLVSTNDADLVNMLQLVRNELDIVVETNNRQNIDEIKGQSEISLFIVDMEMPNSVMFNLLRKEKQRRKMPILFISDKPLPADVAGIECIRKPKTCSEWIRHIERKLSQGQEARSHRQDHDNLTVGALSLNKRSMQAYVDHQEIGLSAKEFMILSYLAENINVVLTRDQIYRVIWKESDLFDPGTLTLYIKNIRNKLGHERECIETVWGIGYRLNGVRV